MRHLWERLVLRVLWMLGVLLVLRMLRVLRVLGMLRMLRVLSVLRMLRVLRVLGVLGVLRMLRMLSVLWVLEVLWVLRVLSVLRMLLLRVLRMLLELLRMLLVLRHLLMLWMLWMLRVLGMLRLLLPLLSHQRAVVLLHLVSHCLLVERLREVRDGRSLLHLPIPRNGGRDLRRRRTGAGILQSGHDLEWRRSGGGEDVMGVWRRRRLCRMKGLVGRGMREGRRRWFVRLGVGVLLEAASQAIDIAEGEAVGHDSGGEEGVEGKGGRRHDVDDTCGIGEREGKREKRRTKQKLKMEAHEEKKNTTKGGALSLVTTPWQGYRDGSMYSIAIENVTKGIFYFYFALVWFGGR